LNGVVRRNPNGLPTASIINQKGNPLLNSWVLSLNLNS
jgi:hypothetical protein